MRFSRVIAFLTAVTVTGAGLMSARAVDPVPHLDGETFVVVRVRPGKIDLTKAVSFLSSKKLIDQGQALAAGLAIGTVKASIDKNVDEMWIGMSTKGLDSGEPLPIIMIPKRDDEQVTSLKSMLARVPNSDLLKMEESNGMLFWGSESGIKAAKAAKGKPRPDLTEAMKSWNDNHSIQIAIIPTADQKKTLREFAPLLAARVPGLDPGEITNQLEWAGVSFDIFPPKARLFIKQADGKAATKAMNFAQKGLDLAPKMLAQQPDARDIVELVGKIVDEMKKGLKVENNGLLMEMENSQPILDLIGESAKKAQEAAKRMQSMNNLKQIGLAFHNTHSAMGAFPSAAITSKDGKPLLSWRVMILPYIEEERLYKQFKLDEPWDSEHNKKLINRMPNTYKNPALKLENGKTTYVVPTGKETTFANPAKGVKLNEITDGTSNTLITMEVPASMAVTWTKPEDWDGGTAGAIEKLLAAVKDGFNVGFGDGSVRYMNKKIDPKVLKAILTPDGGETVEIP